jgi:hypothetical protein
VPQRANCVFRQLVDREISPTKLERRIGTDNDRDDRQMGLVIGRFGQRGQGSRQIVGTSGDQGDYQGVSLSRGGKCADGPADCRGWCISA